MKTRITSQQQIEDSIDRNIDAYRNLAAAVIRQAVEDYRSLERLGYIKFGKVVIPDSVARYREIYQQEAASSNPSKSRLPRSVSKIIKRVLQAEEDIAFFKPNGCLDSWIVAASLNVDADKIRLALGVPCTSPTN